MVPIPDDLDAQLLPELADCIDFIDNARATGAVLVHCEVRTNMYNICLVHCEGRPAACLADISMPDRLESPGQLQWYLHTSLLDLTAR